MKVVNYQKLWEQGKRKQVYIIPAIINEGSESYVQELPLCIIINTHTKKKKSVEIPHLYMLQ